MKNKSAARRFEAEVLDKVGKLREYRKSLSAEPFDAEGVHKMRVLTRRLRETFSFIQITADGKEIAGWARKTKRLTRALGRCRSLDVSLGLLRGEFVRSHPAAARTAMRELERERRDETRLLVKELKRFKANRLRRELRRLFEEKRGRLDRHWRRAGEKLEKRRGAVVRKLGSRNQLKKGRMHELRVEMKKYRYSLEVLASGNASYGKRLRALKTGQRLLGRWHDYQVLAGQLRGIGRGALRPLEKEVRRREEASRRALLERFKGNWKDVIGIR
ncbi:MAG TPA: CHAD domain-containing protein [Candidatus Eisenbacteria bacterium]|nr:CHAD domain-containing protein [Candidatus Eisenbacteria bacterium]